MIEDERAIRQLVNDWMEASRRSDIETVLNLMTDDVIFLIPGQEPFGKAAFAQAAKAMSNVQVEGSSEIVELQILGDWAFIRNRIDMTVVPPAQVPVHRSGYTLTLLRKQADGQWRLARDANLVTVRS